MPWFFPRIMSMHSGSITLISHSSML